MFKNETVTFFTKTLRWKRSHDIQSGEVPVFWKCRRAFFENQGDHHGYTNQIPENRFLHVSPLHRGRSDRIILASVHRSRPGHCVRSAEKSVLQSAPLRAEQGIRYRRILGISRPAGKPCRRYRYPSVLIASLNQVLATLACLIQAGPFTVDFFRTVNNISIFPKWLLPDCCPAYEKVFSWYRRFAMNRASHGSFSFPSRIIPRDTFISGTPASVFHEGPAHSVYRNHAPSKLPVNESSPYFLRKRENLICPTHENIRTASPFSPPVRDSAGCHTKTMLPETDMRQ